tara:strand:+ start:13683 stop:14633 length:951 start_codon:yes stop_codon:yes gene_type:complete
MSNHYPRTSIQSAKTNTNTLLLVDGNNIVHRAYWIAKGQHGGDKDSNLHVDIFLRSIRKAATETRSAKVIVTWDMRKESGPSIRAEESEIYKGTRNKEANKEANAKNDIIIEILASMGILSIYPTKGEADDIIAYVSKTEKNHDRVIILSADTDLLQLIDERVYISSPTKKKVYDEAEFIADYKMTPRDYVRFKSITGDTADNIIGVPRVGKITAMKYMSGEKTLTKEQEEIVAKNYSLIDLCHHTKSEEDIWQAEYADYKAQMNKIHPTPDYKQFLKLCNIHGLDNIIKSKSSFHSKFFQGSTMVNIFNLLRARD